MSKRSYDEFNSEHIKEFEKKKRFKGMLKGNEFKCYNSDWINNSLNLNREKTDEEIHGMVNNARKIWNKKYELIQYITELKKKYLCLYNELPKGRLANNIHWLKNKINEKINENK